MAHKPPTTAQDILRDAVWAHRWVLALAGLLGGICSVLLLTGPFYMLNIYNRVISTHSIETLIALSLIAIYLYATIGLLEYLRGRLLARIAQRCRDACSAPALWRTSPTNAHHAPPPMTRINTVCDTIDSTATTALFDLPWAPVYFGLLFVFHPTLGWLGVLGAACVLLLAWLARAITQRTQGLAQREAALAQSYAHDIAALPTNHNAHWYDTQQRHRALSLRVSDRRAIVTAMSRSLKLMLQSAALGVGAWLVIRSELSAGAMLAGSILMGRALGPVDALLVNAPRLRRAYTDWRSLADDILEPAPSSRRSLPPPTVEAQDVTFVPTGARRPTLRTVSFALAPGETIGLIGPTGAGKTSLLRLITGMARPTAGHLRIFGMPAHRFAQTNPANGIGYLPGQPVLFTGSLLDNITCFAPDPDTTQVEDAIRTCQLSPLIAKLADGLDHWIDPTRDTFSTGEIQQIALARALFGMPQILALDAPPLRDNPALTDRLKQHIQQRNSAGLLTIIASQDTAATTICAHVLHLDQGTIIRVDSAAADRAGAA